MIRSLHERDFETIHRAFLDAFSDYIVPMMPSAEALREMFTRRGWVPELSSGIFDGDRLVAFTMNCLDGARGYDTGSGVVPAYRRRGLARQTMEHSFELLRGAGATRYVLEVLEPNTAAAALYRSVGFIETRRFDCYMCTIEPRESLQSATIRDEWCDVQPSWQNSTASIKRACDRHVVIGDDDCYAVVFPSNGDVAQLAVRPEARGRGLGTRLLETATAIAQKPLRIINVDERNAGIARFLASRGAKRFIRQIEMERML